MLERNKKIYYVLTVVSCSLLSLCTIGIVVNCMGLFIDPIKNYYNVTNGSVSLIITLINITFGLASIFVTPILNKYKLKNILIISVLTCLISLWLFSINNIFNLYYVLALVYGTSACFFSIVTYSIVLHNWFDKGFGTISSLVICFAGIGGVVFSKLINYQIVLHGFRNAFMFVAMLIGLSCIIPILCLHLTPEEVGLTKVVDENKKNIVSNNKTDLKIVRLLLVYIAVISIVRGFSPIVSSFGISKGLDSNAAATLVSLVMVSNIISKPLMGIVSDKYSYFLGNFIGMIIVCLSFIMFRVSTTDLMLKASCLSYGFIYSITTVGVQLILKDSTTNEDFGKYYAQINLTNYVMFALGIYLVGLSFDIFKSYNPTLIILAGLASINIVVLLIIFLNKRKINN